MQDSVSIKIQDDELLGRIVGKEGRNISEIINLASKLNIVVSLSSENRKNELLISTRAYGWMQVTNILRELMKERTIHPTAIQEKFHKAFPSQLPRG